MKTVGYDVVPGSVGKARKRLIAGCLAKQPGLAMLRTQNSSLSRNSPRIVYTSYVFCQELFCVPKWETGPLATYSVEDAEVALKRKI